jgi:hypothetical protein
MLNTKYIIADTEEGVVPYTNDEANGNAWFIKALGKVGSANEEILALDSLKTKIKAVTTSSSIESNKVFTLDSMASIALKEVKPNYLKYESINSNDGFAVFSEIYYGNGWKTFLDGEKVDIIRVNYILRGMEIPKGNHVIEFKFDPDVVKTGSTIALGSSVLLILLLFGALFFEFKKNKMKSA